jgi:enolase-phosphatase E1
MKIAAIVTDIEGTTGGSGFHHDVLMPYSLKHIAGFVREHQDERDVMRALVKLSDRTHIPLHNLEGIIRVLQQWIRDEEPVPELKTLQGMVWEKAYKQGMFQAHVYPDVPEVLQRWQQKERNLYVYSRESVKAQQLFYRYSTEGDMRLLFSGYYDSTLGPKDDPQSYARIAEAIALPPQRVVYISDDRTELDAAAQAGLKTTWVIRPQDTSLDPERVRLKSPHPVVTQFGQIVLE